MPTGDRGELPVEMTGSRPCSMLAKVRCRPAKKILRALASEFAVQDQDRGTSIQSNWQTSPYCSLLPLTHSGHPHADTWYWAAFIDLPYLAQSCRSLSTVSPSIASRWEETVDPGARAHGGRIGLSINNAKAVSRPVQPPDRIRAHAKFGVESLRATGARKVPRHQAGMAWVELACGL